MNFLKKLIPPFILLLLVATIGIINFVPNTVLTGWDNLHPEFNLLLNIKRSIFSTWQEYQSLGLLGGMGHASDLVRQLFLLLISSVIPEQSLRYLWTILTLLIGGAGAYFLTSTVMKNSRLGFKQFNSSHLPLLAGIFYILNLATIQSYYVPFETFSAHFAFLPWMILTTLLFFNRPNFRNGVILFTTLFLSTPQSYVPTLFVVYMLAVSIILGLSAIKLLLIRRTKYLFNILIKYFAILLSANAFWLLPFAYFTLTNSSTNLNAKINQMATEQIILQNKEFGTIQDTALLKGFWFNAVEPTYQEGSQYLLLPWREYLSSTPIQLLGYSLFAVILLGVVATFRKREMLPMAFGALFIFTFAMLANATPPFSWLVELLRHVPLFEQSFRFPFTKFSILASLLYAYFFAIGSGEIIRMVSAVIKKYSLKTKTIANYLLLLLFTSGVIIFSLPVFKGDLFYRYEQLTMPNEYQQLFSFFEKQDPSTRITTLPIQTFWGWNSYTWGYGGSGFLWYGIQQPIVDRAFDVWSENSEGSYYELSNALYSNNFQAFEKTLNKFDITWIILDKNIYSPLSPRSLRYEETEKLLRQIPSVTKAAEYGNIVVYKTSVNDDIENFLSSKPLLQGSNTYKYAPQDIHYNMYGDYKSGEDAAYSYPFRTLFSNKRQIDKEFGVKKEGSGYVFENTVGLKAGTELLIPSLLKESLIPVEVKTEKTQDNSLIITAHILLPQVQTDNNLVYGDEEASFPLFTIPEGANEAFTINLNGNKVPHNSRTYISTRNANIFVFENSTLLASQSIEPSQLEAFETLKEKKVALTTPVKKLTVTVPEVINTTNGVVFTAQMISPVNECPNQRKGTSSNILTSGYRELISMNATFCASAYASELSHDEAYIINGSVKNVQGRGLHFWLLNDSQGNTPIDTYFDKTDTEINMVISPQEQYAKGYSLHFDNVSVGKDEVRNQIKSFSMTTIPYNFLTQMVGKVDIQIADNSLVFTTTHPNESLYRLSNIEAKNSNIATLTLSQSYDSGWNAYIVNNDNKMASLLPFIFGEKIRTHVKVNNWSNGWEINPVETQNKDIVIVYLPQYLQYVGFLMLALMASLFLLKPFRPYWEGSWDNFNSFFDEKSKNMKHKVSILLSNSSY